MLERGEDDGRAAFGGQNCSIYAARGPGSLDAAAPRTAQVRGWRMIGYFIDDAPDPFHLQLPGKGIDCDAISNNSDAEEGIRTNSVE